jgi:hypothetical protein
MGTYTLPTMEGIAHLIEQLLGRKVGAKVGKPLALGPSAKGYAAVYRSDTGAPAGLVLLDLPLGANIGAALAMVPAAVAGESVRAGKLAENLLDNLREVMNVAGRTFNVEGHSHVKLSEIIACPPALPADLAGLQAKGVGIHLEMTVTGYSGGRLSAYVNPS